MCVVKTIAKRILRILIISLYVFSILIFLLSYVLIPLKGNEFVQQFLFWAGSVAVIILLSYLIEGGDSIYHGKIAKKNNVACARKDPRYLSR